MSYRVRIDSFEGPFDLLLYLVSRQRVDIGSISVAQIVDQYIAYVDRMEKLDLDVASDFLLVASTLLEIKASSLIPQEQDEMQDELDELSPSEARDILIERLIRYKQFKNASASLGARFELEGRMHPRMAGPDKEFLGLMPDYLEHVSLDSLGLLAAEAIARRDVFLLESEHIAAKPIPVETHVRAIHRRISARKHMMFSELLEGAPTLPVRVVSFLAVLELYKRTMVTLEQEEPFSDIAINFVEGSGELVFDEEDEKEWS
ncbi:segregation and condensation protein A [Slackia piriformis]|uniref:segregation and condensation protein A n=1 Tax=Slackia piriformis TaxID=626934 RepID=UPI0023F05CCA|nr:segregation/condensation protein A [Slackia piriformis]